MKYFLVITFLFAAPGLFAQTLITNKLCFPKKEIPKGLQVVFENGNVKFLNDSEKKFVLARKIQSEINFPKSILPNQLPVAVYLNDKRFQMSKLSFESRESWGNPLSADFDGIEAMSSFNCVMCSEEIPLITNSAQLTQEQIRKFYEIPFNYYFGEKYIANKLRLYFKGMNRITIAKVVPLLPLPDGFKITFSDQTKMDSRLVYSLLTFHYSGQTPITFVKDFQEPVQEQVYLQSKEFPILIIEKNKCFHLSPETYVITSRESGKRYYDEYLLKETRFANRVIDSQAKRESYLNNIKQRNLYQLIPLGYTFTGNGRTESKCELNLKDMEYSFFGKISSIRTNDDESIYLSPDEVSSVELFNEKTQSKLHLIKRMFVKKNSKNSHLILPKYDWKDKDLVCGEWE